MAVLNLRNVPEELMRRLRSDAALAGRGNHFHEHCIGLLERGLAVSLHAPKDCFSRLKTSSLQNPAQIIPENIPAASVEESLETRIT